MPEIIDLEVARENMLKKVKNEELRTVKVSAEKVLQNATPEDVIHSVEGKTLVNIDRVAKLLEFRFEDASLVFHLMLHGDFCWEKSEKEKNVVVAMEFESGTILVKDWSQWMKVEVHDPENGFTSKLLESEYGIDPLSEEFTVEVLNEILMKRSRSGIKAILMDQKEVAGIGNAYADESLWEAKIHPSTRCKTIVEEKREEDLLNAICTVLNESLDIVRELSGGISISEQDRDFMKVYRKSGQKCPRCGYMIACLKVNGRDTFVCEKCQEKS